MFQKQTLNILNIENLISIYLCHVFYLVTTHLRRSLSCGSIPGRLITKPGGVLDMSNLLTTFRQSPIRTKNPCIVLLTTAIGGCKTFGKKL